MSSTTAGPAMLATHDLAKPPTSGEIAVVEAQAARVAAMLSARPAHPEAMFIVEPQAFAATLARLADEARA